MLLLSGLALAAEPAASPDRASAPQWTVTVDPLTTALGFVHVQVERALGPRVSVYAGPSLRLFDSVLGFPPGSFRGYGAEVGVRGFVWGTAPRGAWVMARGVLADVVSEGQGRIGGYTSLLGGFTGIVGPGLVLSGGLGVSWFDYGGSSTDQGGVHGVLPAAHTNIGWAF
ncbi:MAG: hypothetical protein Q7U06_02290 [Pseudomonadota bacterium]|nr:hypothetical protein [Pseudomonadota bacterium]